jgi:dihydroflavonol-4-reductase
MSRALVTGSTGGVGATLVAALNARDIEVIGLQRKTSPQDAIEGLTVKPVVGDILDPPSLRPAMEGVDWVFHAAAIADDWNFPAATILKVNVEGAKNVMQAALDAGVKRFVLVSSAAALGVPAPGREMLDESCTYNSNPRDWPYGYSKHLAEQAMAEYAAKGLHAVAVLPTAIMGPRDVKFISGELIVRVLRRELMPFPDGGLNFIDTRDVVDGILSAAQKGRAGERYVLGGHNMTHVETLRIIGEVLNVPIRHLKLPHWTLPPLAGVVDLLHRLGVKLPIERQRVLLSGKTMYYDNRKAVSELGLSVRPFDETVRDAYQWYAENGYLQKRGIKVPAG